MSRPWRIEYPGALYHVMSRGNERKPIFRDTDDRLLFLDLLGKASDRFDIEIYAYVLMTNHYHILLKTNESNLSRSMQWFGATYTRRYNIHHKRSGHLFQGRFKSFLIQNDDYLLRLSCYIHRNPLRAGMVKRLADYRWSSYLSYGYGKKELEWHNTGFIFSLFKGNRQEKCIAYRRMVQMYSNEEKKTLENLRHGLVFGSLAFINDIRNKYLPDEINKEKPEQAKLNKSVDIAEQLEKAAKIIDVDIKELKNAGRLRGDNKFKRDLVIYLLWKTGYYTNEQIGNAVGISYSGVSKSISMIKKNIQKDNELKKRYNNFNSQFKM
jgi:REP-associated tyrosine transposase